MIGLRVWLYIEDESEPRVMVFQPTYFGIKGAIYFKVLFFFVITTISNWYHGYAKVLNTEKRKFKNSFRFSQNIRLKDFLNIKYFVKKR